MGMRLAGIERLPRIAEPGSLGIGESFRHPPVQRILRRHVEVSAQDRARGPGIRLEKRRAPDSETEDQRAAQVERLR